MTTVRLHLLQSQLRASQAAHQAFTPLPWTPFIYQSKRLTDCANSTALHSALICQDAKDFSSAFTPITPPPAKTGPAVVERLTVTG